MISSFPLLLHHTPAPALPESPAPGFDYELGTPLSVPDRHQSWIPGVHALRAEFRDLMGHHPWLTCRSPHRFLQPTCAIRPWSPLKRAFCDQATILQAMQATDYCPAVQWRPGGSPKSWPGAACLQAPQVTLTRRRSSRPASGPRAGCRPSNATTCLADRPPLDRRRPWARRQARAAARETAGEAPRRSLPN